MLGMLLGLQLVSNLTFRIIFVVDCILEREEIYSRV